MPQQRSAMMIEPNTRNQQLRNQTAQSPETIRQSGLQISDDLRQICAQLAQDNEQLQQELNEIATTACNVFDTVANRIQAQQDNWNNVRDILSKYRTALTQLPQNSPAGSSGAVGRALDEHFQATNEPRSVRDPGQVRLGGSQAPSF